MTDEYSQQVERLKDVVVDTSAFKADPPWTVATITEGPINGWGTIFDLTMNTRMTETGKFNMAKQLYVPWDYDVANMQKGIEDAIAQKVDAILLTSMSRSGLAASVERATNAGIPVIQCMAGVSTDKYTAEVSAPPPIMGYDAAKAIAEKIGGKGTVVMLHGIAGIDAAELGSVGAHAAFAEYPGIRLVEQNANWSTVDAVNVMRTILVQEPKIDGLYVGGFEMAVGAIQAFQEVGRDIPFIGGSSITNGFLRVAKDLNLDFFAVHFPPAGSATCVDTMVAVLEGRPVQKYQDVWNVMDDVQPFGPEKLDDYLKPNLNDDYVGPAMYPDQVYIDAGFGQ
jgi:ABC-type sugar transport system substrate-binding protein